MRLTDFFGADVGYKQRVVTVLSFGGEPLPIRHLCLEEFFVLSGQFGHIAEAIKRIAIGESSAKEVADLEQDMALAVRLLYPESKGPGSFLEYLNLIKWYWQSHDWDRIVEEFKSTDEVSDEEALELFMMVDRTIGRSLEVMLAMRPEAALDAIDYAQKIVNEKMDTVKKEAASQANEAQPGSTGFINTNTTVRSESIEQALDKIPMNHEVVEKGEYDRFIEMFRKAREGSDG